MRENTVNGSDFGCREHGDVEWVEDHGSVINAV